MASAGILEGRSAASAAACSITTPAAALCLGHRQLLLAPRTNHARAPPPHRSLRFGARHRGFRAGRTGRARAHSRESPRPRPQVRPQRDGGGGGGDRPSRASADFRSDRPSRASADRASRRYGSSGTRSPTTTTGPKASRGCLIASLYVPIRFSRRSRRTPSPSSRRRTRRTGPRPSLPNVNGRRLDDGSWMMMRMMRSSKLR